MDEQFKKSLAETIEKQIEQAVSEKSSTVAETSFLKQIYERMEQSILEQILAETLSRFYKSENWTASARAGQLREKAYQYLLKHFK